MRRLGWFAVGFALATISVLFLSPTLILWQILAGMAVVSVAVYRWKPKAWKRVSLVLLGASVSLLWLQHLATVQEQWNEAHQGSDMTMVATALDYSTETLYYGSMVEIQWDDCNGYLYLDELVEIAPGDTITAVCRVTPSVIDGELDDLWKKAVGIDFTANQTGDWSVESATHVSPRFYPVVFAQKIRATLPEIANENTQSFLRALLLGESDDLSELFYNQMCMVGTVHTVAISGMHFSMLMAMLMVILGRGRRGAVVILVLVWFYALAVGAKPSVVRSAIMFTFLLLAPILGRERDVTTSILGALLFILVQNPWAMFSVSLQYSFSTVTMICLFGDKIFAGIWEHPKVRPLRKKHRWLGKLLRILGQPLCCTLAVIPASLVLGAYYFELFSIVAPISNLLIQPAIAVIFCLALPVTTVGMASAALGTVLMTPLEWLVEYVMLVTKGLAQIPYAAMFVNNGYMVILACYILAVSLVALIGRAKYGRILPAIYALGILCLCCMLSSWEYDRQDFSMTMLDIGQGQCIYLESGGQNIGYDCGGSVDNPGEELARYLQSIGRSSLDGLVISHYDSDHAGGVTYFLQRAKVGTLFLPPYQGDNEMEAEILEMAAAVGVPVVHVTQDMTWDFGNGTLSLYAPMSQKSENDRSLALLFSMGDFDALMTGDMGVSAEKALVYQKQITDLEVFVAGHHGSKDSTGTGLLNTTLPEIVLVSAGKDNGYGHPSEATLARLADIDATVYRTDLQGNITIRR